MKIIDNWLSTDQYKMMQYDSQQCYDACCDKDDKRFSFFLNYNNWVDGVIRNSNVVLISDVPTDCYTYDIFTKHMERFDLTLKWLRFYYWLPGSYIPWHTDSNNTFAVTYYLNDDWDRNNGGFLLHGPEDDIKAVEPKGNRLVINTDYTPHSTTIIAPGSDIRCTIQGFG